MCNPTQTLTEKGVQLKDKIIKKLLDLDTGELIEIKEGDKVKITSQKQTEAIQKSYDTKEKNDEIREWSYELGGFIFVLFKYCNQLFKDFEDIKQEDITKLFYLATFVDYNGCLVYNCSFMNKLDMQKNLNISTSCFYEFYSKMIDCEIFLEQNNKIIINQEYFIKGNLVKQIQKQNDYTRVYIRTIRYLYENVSIRQHSQLGNYFKIIPFIHRQQNVLCWNPDEINNQVQLMHVNELKEILGCHRNTVRSFIKNMLSVRLSNGEAILGFFRTEYDEGLSYIIVNPRVFYGGNFNLKGGKQDIIRWFERK